jgi:hypothetical protein
MKPISAGENSLLDGVGCGTVEHHGVDHGLDDHAAPHELADRIRHVGIVTAEAIDPADHQHVAGPKHVE